MFFFVVVSTGIETPLKFLFSSFSVVGLVTGIGLFLTVLVSSVEVVGCGVVRLLVVLGCGVVDIVEEGLVKMIGSVTLGVCVVNNCLLIVVCFVISGWGLLKLFGMIWLNIVGLVFITFCPNTGDPAPLFCGTFDWVFPISAKFFRSFLNWFNDWSSRRFAF